jgi:hypothetical protein
VGRHVARPDEYLYTDLKSFKKENAYQMVAWGQYLPNVEKWPHFYAERTPWSSSPNVI